MTGALYRYFNAAEELLYVGISVNVVARLAGHRADPWHREIATIRVEHFSTVDEAADAELVAIKTEGPRYNVSRSRYVPRGRGAPPVNPEIERERKERQFYARLAALREKVNERRRLWHPYSTTENANAPAGA